MKAVVSKVVDLVNELHEITSSDRFSIKISPNGFKEVHVLQLNSFLNLFKTFDVEERGTDMYPYEAFTEIDDVKFFALLTHEDYVKYAKKQVHNAPANN